MKPGLFFKLIFYSKAGVYGDDEWEKVARFDPALTEEFTNRVNSLEDSK